jgi:hypothetical protein
MLDRPAQALIAPALQAAGRWLVRHGVTADAITWAASAWAWRRRPASHCSSRWPGWRCCWPAG